MQTLRSAHHLARLVLVWFALSLGVAIASPVVNPQDLQMVCTGSGAMKLVVTNADGDQDTALAQHALPIVRDGFSHHTRFTKTGFHPSCTQQFCDFAASI
ncbi:MAG: hypothetical protein IPQ12_09165 [Polaromonas sp.]|nr:hypothetical protein [Polaromonas sp.]